MKIASLCTGYAGLDMAVHAVFGGELARVADIDPDASNVLAHRFPGVPNLGDIKAVDWLSLGAVDLLSAGYSCQPFSQAGRRLGTADERHVWPNVAHAIGELRPALVVLENVQGHLTLGFDIVLADLAALGYDAEWVLVTASSAGACHRRARLFILAFPASDRSVPGVPVAAISDGAWLEPRESLFGILPFGGTVPASGSMAGGYVYAADGPGTAMAAGLMKTPIAQLAVNGGSQHPDKRRAGGHGPTLADQVEHELAFLPTPNATDGQGGPRALPERRTSHGKDHGPRLRDVAPALFPTPSVADATGGHVSRSGDRKGEPLLGGIAMLLPTPAAGNFNDGESLESWEARRAGNLAKGINGNGQGTPLGIAVRQDWGRYEAAVRRWEAVLGRPAPAPTVPGKTGDRLSPGFVEFLMGLPEGWVTDVPGLSRNAMLKILGNGVVPQQGELALRILLARSGLAEAGEAA